MPGIGWLTLCVFGSFIMAMELVDKVRAAIKKHRMLEQGDSVLAAVSGGPDSVALLDLLFELKDDFSLRVSVAHYHHQLRGKEADLDERLASELAKKYQLDFIPGQAEPEWWKKLKGSVEETARKMRYEFLEQAALKIRAQKIALGHNADDRTESFLINMLRGSGLLGLAGMPPLRGKIIRPLIEVSREEIIDYLNERGLAFRIDKTNLDKKILRNRIRAELVPMLKSYNPKIIAAINRTSEILSEDEKCLEAWTEEIFARLAQVKGGKASVTFSVQQLVAQPVAVQRRLIRRAIQHLKKDLRRIEAEHSFELESLLEAKSPSFEIDLPQGVRILRSYDQLIIERIAISDQPVLQPMAARPLAVAVKVPMKQHIALSSEFEIELSAELSDYQQFEKNRGERTKRESIFVSGFDQEFLALDNIQGALTLRSPKPGDRIQPLGMKGHRKLKKIFIELKVPRELRKIYPVLADDKELIWVPGFSLSEKAKVKPDSAPLCLLKLSLMIR